MIAGGLQKNSMIDYPGAISCVLFLAGCNFDCPYCHNPELVQGCSEPGLGLAEEDFYGFLADRKGLLDGVVISGGEPTLNPEIFTICERIKKLGYAVKLDTNGSRPRTLKALLDQGLVDYIAMDIKTDPFHYSPLIKKEMNVQKLLAGIRIIMESSPAYEFRTTCVKPFVDEETISRIARYIQGARLYVLQPFQAVRVLHPEFFDQTNPGYSDAELRRLQGIASPWVQTCKVRFF